MQTPHDPVSLPRLPGSQGARAAETVALHSAALCADLDHPWTTCGPWKPSFLFQESQVLKPLDESK